MSTPVPPRGGRARNNRNRNRPAGRAQNAPRATSGSGGRQASARQAAFQQRRRRQHQLVFGGIGLVLVVVIVLVIVAVTSSNKPGGSNATPLASASVLSAIKGVSPESLATQAKNDTNGITYPVTTQGKNASLTADGKPKIVYIGAEYCPYCGGERWAMIMALSKFGTFTGIKQITSSPTDSAAQSVPSFSFVGSTYSSPYLVFDPTETETVTETPLQTPSKADDQLEAKYDTSPYTDQAGSIPFIDFANKWIVVGASYDVTGLQHLSHQTVAQAAATGSPKYGADIQAVAGAFVSRICQLTQGKPGNVRKSFPSVIGGK